MGLNFTDLKWAVITNLPAKSKISMCRPHDKDTVAASRAATFTKENKDSKGCRVCLGKNDHLLHPLNLVTCTKCEHSAHWECVGIPVNANTKPSSRPEKNRTWDCIYCMHLCESCYKVPSTSSQCASCLKLICQNCQGIVYFVRFRKYFCRLLMFLLCDYVMLSC